MGSAVCQKLKASRAGTWLGQGKRKGLLLVPAGLLALVIIVGIGGSGGGDAREAMADQSQAAIDVDRLNVQLDDSSFADTGVLVLDGVERMDKAYLKENLSLSPHQGFTVTKRSPNSSIARIQVTGHRSGTYTLSLALPGTDPLKWRIESKGAALTAKLVKSRVAAGESIFIEFSEPLSTGRLQSYMKISPEVAYEVRCDGVLAEIILAEPESNLGEYTIQLSKDLTSSNDKTLDRDVSLRVVVTEPEDRFEVNMTNRYVVIAPSDRPITLEFDTAQPKDSIGVPAVITTYRFEDLEKYTSQSSLFIKHMIDPAPLLEKVDTNVAELSPGVSAVELQNPGVGGYLIRVVYTNTLTGLQEVLHKQIMVTDIDVYMQSVNGENLLWANSTATGQPLAGHTVEFLNLAGTEIHVTGETDAGGVAIMEGETDEYYTRGDILRIRDPEGAIVYVDKTSAPSWYQRTRSGRYFSYLYMDRSIYKPTDEISFWGMVRPHASNDEPTVTEVNLVLDPGGLEQTVTVELNANGIFQGTMALEQIKSSNYRFELHIPYPEPVKDYRGNEVNHRRLDYEYIEVKEYEKPMFTIAAEVDKALYNHNETVTLRVEPTFYDGTPLPNYELELTVFDSYYGTSQKQVTFKTDDDGVGTVKFPVFQHSGNELSWQVLTNRYQVRIISDGENIVHNGSYRYVPTDAKVTGTITEVSARDLQLEVETGTMSFQNLVAAAESGAGIEEAPAPRSEDLGLAESGETEDEADPYRIIPTDQTVTARATIECYESDTGYSRKTFTQNDEFETKDGKAIVPIELPDEMNTDRSYSVEVTLTVKDQRQRDIQYTAYYHYYPNRGTRTPQDEGKEKENVIEGYSFAVTRGDGENALSRDDYRYYNIATFADGEQMNFQLLLDGEPVENTGRILYTIIQDTVVDYGFATGSTLSFTQSTRWANNINFVAAYFDGQHVHTIHDTVVNFEQESARLDVAVTADKETYMPGETVRLQMKVTDQNGRGVAGNALISVVDESVFALREQYVNTLDTLYGDLSFYNYHVSKYTTLTSQGVPEYEGKGDIGKDDANNLAFYDMYRKNFKDTAAFLPLRTDSGGNGSVTFTLPDNTTSWRVTSIAIGDNFYAGNSKMNIASAMPFFVAPVISSKYIEGDDVSMLIQGHGILLDKESEIDYTVRITGDGVDETYEVGNTAYKANQISFGKLAAGEYTVVATAKFGGWSDTVEVPLAVVSSNLELVVNRELDLKKPLDVKAVRYPVTISFYDEEYTAYQKSIGSLLSHYCMIANQRMSRFVAKRALMRYMDPAEVPQHIRVGNDSASDMQNSDGGIGWNVGDPSEVLLTTQVLLIAKDQFNLNSMTEYYRKVLERGGITLGGDKEDDGTVKRPESRGTPPTAEEVASSYLGLAYIGEPVADEVMALLGKPETTLLEKAYLVAALAYAGEEELALSQYDLHLKPVLVTDSKGTYAKTGATGDMDDRITRTTWVAASRLHLEDADAIAMSRNQGWQIGSLFECMAYVTNYSKTVEPRSFTYTIGDTQYTADLTLNGQKTIVLSKSEFEGFQLGTVPDTLKATAYYIGEPSEVDFERSDNIGIEKKITRVQDDRYKVDIIVQLQAGAPAGYYDISDWVPSNMRFYDMNTENYRSGSNWYFDKSAEGQKLYFRIYNYGDAKRCLISYYIQRTYDAEVMLDSTYIIHGNSGASNYTPRQLWKESEVTVGEAEKTG